MNEDQFDDLKQFIDARLSQSEQSIKVELKADIEQLRVEMHDGFAGVGEAIDESQAQTDKVVKDLDQRLTKLEHQIAA